MRRAPPKPRSGQYRVGGRGLRRGGGGRRLGTGTKTGVGADGGAGALWGAVVVVMMMGA